MRQIEEQQQENMQLAYWLTNTITLLLLLHNNTTVISNSGSMIKRPPKRNSKGWLWSLAGGRAEFWQSCCRCIRCWQHQETQAYSHHAPHRHHTHCSHVGVVVLTLQEQYAVCGVQCLNRSLTYGVMLCGVRFKACLAAALLYITLPGVVVVNGCIQSACCLFRTPSHNISLHSLQMW